VVALATLLTPQEVAAQLNISVRQLHTMRRNGQGPDWLQLNKRTVRYVSDDVVQWLKSKQQA